MYCEMCGRRIATCKHHLVFGNGLRQLADKDNLCLTLCDNCHNMGKVTERIHDNPAAERLSKMLGQAIYERNMCERGMSIDESRESFRKRYGKSYL